MNRAPRRVVITGLGVVSPLGIGKAEFWDALAAGRSGIARLESIDPDGLPTSIGGEVRGYDPKKFVPTSQRKNLKVMARDIQLAVGAARLVFEDAGLSDNRPDPQRIGIDFGASMISSELNDLAASAVRSRDAADQFDYRKWGTEAMGHMPPLWLLKYLPNMPSCHISILYDLQGPSNSITQAEAASNLAIGEAFRIIARGAADVMVAGGCDSKINPLALIRLCLLEACSRRNDAPAEACRPFDSDRDGMVAAEGAAAVMLEELEHARRRGARIYGELVGFGTGCDARPAGAALDGTGYRVALAAALRDAGMTPGALGYYNAHGAGTREGDLVEARALHDVFGDHAARIPVSAHKSGLGNAMAGCGALEFVAGLLALEHGLIPPSLNCPRPDPRCRLNVVTGTPRPLERPSFVSVNATRLGQAAALIVRKLEDA